MGLFSKAKKSQSHNIPQEYLDAVSINSAPREVTPTKPAAKEVASEPATESPFLHTSTAAQPATPTPAPQKPVSDPSPQAPQRVEGAVDGAIHFANTAEAPGNLPIHEGGEKKVPDFSNITKEPALKNSSKAFPMNTGSKKSFFSKANIVSLGVFLATLLLITGGSWYYLNTRSEKSDTLTGDEAMMVQELPEGDTASPTPTTISVNQANHLKIDVESVSASDIRALLDAQGKIISDEAITEPVEYLVTDLDDNPISFSRFAFLVSASQPSDLVDAAEEGFSLYLTNSEGELRIGLAVPLSPTTGDDFPQNPQAVLESLKNLLYSDIIQVQFPQSIEFHRSSYKDKNIQYVNLNQVTQTSFDFTIDTTTHTFLLSNSKDSLRAMIDKTSNPLQ